MSLRVLVVEDDREIRTLMQSSLSVEGFAVQTAVSLSEASAMLRHSPPELICWTWVCPMVMASCWCARCASA